jgi:DNA modification methylase
MKAIPDKSIDLVVTDPPYDIGIVGGGYCGTRNGYRDIEFMSCGFSPAVLDELCWVMKRINIYLFCSQKQIIPLLDYFSRDRKCYWNLITWHKTNPIPACNNRYLPDTEYILFFREKGVPLYGRYKTKFTYYVTPSNQKEKKQWKHPTIKPVNILENFILNSSQPGETVLDPFMGSGSTGLASVNTGRKFIGIERKREYLDISRQRINTAVFSA